MSFHDNIANLCWSCKWDLYPLIYVEKVAPVYPNPETMFMTPGGNPASIINWPSIKAVNGVCSAGFQNNGTSCS